MITDPRIIRFCNEQLRPIADQMAGAFNDLSAALRQWDGQKLATAITDVAAVVADGAPEDGRGPITGRQLLAMIELWRAYSVNTQSQALVFGVAVNPR